MRKFGWISVLSCLLCSILSGEVLYDVVDLGPGSAYSINDNGNIVGQNNTGQAVIFDNTGNTNNTILLPESPNNDAHGINNNGTIIGEDSNTGTIHAVIFDSNGGIDTDIGEGYAFAVNNNDQVAGRRGTMAFSWGSA